MTAQLQVWVAYASVEQQILIPLSFNPGMTVEDAIVQSGIRKQVDLPEVLTLGIFGARVSDSSQLLEAGDRVEIYRALTINPKDIRRNRAKKNPVGRYCRGNRFKQLYL
ncbi:MULTISPECIES: RnfH family protein [unclassified Acinetobacter]|jgi:Uncharacterized protein conserved in bacteria|uniref:RnfH family protein n=1 Tax=unclassified Acinetobacter TaxID=196816 RepID=UPI0015D2445A|nr:MULTISPECIES: RnfH family protein [unclassified Acinetobacter]